MKVIGAGFGRTSTMSIKVALEELGFGPCYHMTELLNRPDHVHLWDAAVQGEPIDWDEVFKDYQSTLDWPGCGFYKELMEVYPEAKVILTVRDPESWYDSAVNNTYELWKTANAALLVSLSRPVVPEVMKALRMIDNLIWQGTFGGKFEDRQHAIEAFERHIEEVKEYVPAGRLLVYDAKDGWEPLCEFLGVEAPDKPFPHLNDTKSFQKFIRKRFVLPYAALTAGEMAVRLSLLNSRNLLSRLWRGSAHKGRLARRG